MTVKTELKNVAAERATLAGICQHGLEVHVEVAPFLCEEVFTLPNNKVLFQCINHTLKSQDTIDFSSLLASATALGLGEYVEKKEVLSHFEAVLNTPIKIENVREHATTIRKLQLGRELQNSSRDIYRAINSMDGSETVSELISMAEQPIQALCLKYMREDQSVPKDIGLDIDSYIDYLLDNPCDQIGLPTGFNEFDRALGGGLRRKCVDVIGARSGVGKSIIADNIAYTVAKTGVPVLMLDTEMGNQDHINRLLANLSLVEINEIATGQFGSDASKRERVRDAAVELKNLKYKYLNVSGRPFEEIISVMRRWILKDVGYDENGTMRDCLIVYDYLKMMTSDGMENIAEFQALGFQITQLHNFCVEYDCPCLTFVQLNRDGITKESTDAVSGSDRIIWLCTSFSIFKEKTEEEIVTDTRNAGNTKLVPLKTRHGPGMTDGYICMNRQGQYAKLTELGTVKTVAERERLKRDGFEQTGTGEPQGFGEVED